MKYILRQAITPKAAPSSMFTTPERRARIAGQDRGVDDRHRRNHPEITERKQVNRQQ